MSLAQQLKDIIRDEQYLPAEMRGIVDEISATAVEMLKVATSSLSEAVYSGATPNKDFILKANRAFLDEVLNSFGAEHPEQIAKLKHLIEYVKNEENIRKISAKPGVQKATTAAIKGIRLNTRGEFVVKDKEIRDIADRFAKRFSLKPIWARNLIGMFDISIPYADRLKFLEACEKGTALDVSDMIKRGQGSLEDVVTTKIPKIREVFASVQETLFDISLSTGQRGATGPFEALIAIMGGGRKPSSQEGGDIVVKSEGKDIKLELKSGSISIKAETGKVSGLSGAWLDSTAGGEISPSKLRSVADSWLANNFPLAFKNAQLSDLWKKSDFRPGDRFKKTNLVNFSNFLKLSEKKKPGMSREFIGNMMSTMFPSITAIKGYDFSEAVENIIDSIYHSDNKAIAKEQGVMALLEYIVGKGNDGFLLCNNSTQEYKAIMGVKGVLDLYHSNDTSLEKSIVRFEDPMTMLQKTTKCSPSIYFGPSNTSIRAKKYAEKFMSDPERVRLRARAEAAGDPVFNPDHPINADMPPVAPIKIKAQPTPRTKRKIVSEPVRKKRT